VVATPPANARGFCLPALGHGTAVAGIIAAVAPGASILPVTVLDSDGWGNAVAVTARRWWLAHPPGDPGHALRLSFLRRYQVRPAAGLALVPVVPDHQGDLPTRDTVSRRRIRGGPGPGGTGPGPGKNTDYAPAATTTHQTPPTP
jgi:hypothetical protein